MYIFHQNVVVVTSRFFENMKVGILERKIDRNCSSSEIIKLCELSLVLDITMSFVLRVEKSSL